MSGHGHVTPNADGTKARCGGPGLCSECALEQARASPKTQINKTAAWCANCRWFCPLPKKQERGDIFVCPECGGLIPKPLTDAPKKPMTQEEAAEEYGAAKEVRRGPSRSGTYPIIYGEAGEWAEADFLAGAAWQAEQDRERVEKLEAVLEKIATDIPGCDSTYLARKVLAPDEGKEPADG